MKVQAVITHWNTQANDNPLWIDKERDLIRLLIRLIEGKRKADAITHLQTYINQHDGMSSEATFARSFVRKLQEIQS